MKLCQKNYYDGTKFHRSIRHFMVSHHFLLMLVRVEMQTSDLYIGAVRKVLSRKVLKSKVLMRKVLVLENDTIPHYIRPNLTTLSRAVFFEPFAWGWLSGPF